MLLKLPVQQGIRDGTIDLVFRRWRKPTVKAGGRLRCAVGELAIASVEQIEPSEIDDAQAMRAGYPSKNELIFDLFRERSPNIRERSPNIRERSPNIREDSPRGGRSRMAQVDESSLLYRVTVTFAGVDQRAALRETLLDDIELQLMLVKLAKMDERSIRGAWTATSLGLIATWPGRRAPELAEMVGCDTLPWKAEIRRLKELGLTESLSVGYRLSPRGIQVLAAF